MKDDSVADLFALKSVLEAQFASDYLEGENAESVAAFDFLIGEWDVVRTSFDQAGNAASQTQGSVVAQYTFGGRFIQEDFSNFRADGVAYRDGTALYTYNPSSEQWHVAASDASTGATSYQPTWHGGEVHYDSVIRLPDREVLTKSRVFNIRPDSYEWEQKLSVDGVAWFPNYHIINSRRAAAVGS